MGLNKADLSRTKRYSRIDDTDWIKGNDELGVLAHPEHEGDDAWIEIRTSLTGREDDRIADLTASERLLNDAGQVSLRQAKLEIANPAVFDMLAVSWSLADGKPKREDYNALEIVDRTWINRCINNAIGIARGEAEGNVSSPGTAAQLSNSRDSSSEEADPAPAS